jgi:hypothetical protein
LASACALLAAHLATAASDSLGPHFLDLAQHPSSIVPDLFEWPTALNWTWSLITQTILISAVILTVKSVMKPRAN